MVYPWYTVYGGTPDISSQCPDKSDQIFNITQTCRQHLQQHMDFHSNMFCDENFSFYYYEYDYEPTTVNSELICTKSLRYQRMGN